MPYTGHTCNHLIWKDLVLCNMGDTVSAIMAIDTPNEALQFYNNYVRYLRGNGMPGKDAERVARSNIGWCFGEGMSKEMQDMWYQATGSEHPVWGMENPGPLKAFEMGVAMGKNNGRL